MHKEGRSVSEYRCLHIGSSVTFGIDSDLLECFCIKVLCVHFAFRKYSECWCIYETSLDVFPMTKLDFFYVDFLLW